MSGIEADGGRVGVRLLLRRYERKKTRSSILLSTVRVCFANGATGIEGKGEMAGQKSSRCFIHDHILGTAITHGLVLPCYEPSANDTQREIWVEVEKINGLPRGKWPENPHVYLTPPSQHRQLNDEGQNSKKIITYANVHGSSCFWGQPSIVR